MKIVIVGATAAGTSAAAKAKRLLKDATVKMLEKTEVLSFGACGLPYFVGDFFSDENEMVARTKEQFEKSGIEVATQHEVVGVDTNSKVLKVKTPSGEISESYDKLMIATGAAPFKLPFIKKDFGNLFNCKTMADGLALKEALQKESIQDVTIIGGGFIGLELVEACLKLKKNVRLIELAPSVMGTSFDPSCTDLFAEELEKHEVALHLGEKVESFVGEENITFVKTDAGEYKTDLVIVSTGVVPNTQFLGEEFAKLKNGALLINEKGETSVKDVYAAGDCASIKHVLTGDDVYIPLATYANKLGRIVGENLAGADKTFAGALGSVGIKVLDLEAGKTGLTAAEMTRLNIPFKTVTIQDKNHTSYYPGQVPLHGVLHYDPETKVILGGQIVGKRDAVLRVDVIACAIAKEMTTEELGFLDLIYAPPFARTWDFLNVIGNVAK